MYPILGGQRGLGTTLPDMARGLQEIADYLRRQELDQRTDLLYETRGASPEAQREARELFLDYGGSVANIDPKDRQRFERRYNLSLESAFRNLRPLETRSIQRGAQADIAKTVETTRAWLNDQIGKIREQRAKGLVKPEVAAAMEREVRANAGANLNFMKQLEEFQSQGELIERGQTAIQGLNVLDAPYRGSAVQPPAPAPPLAPPGIGAGMSASGAPPIGIGGQPVFGLGDRPRIGVGQPLPDLGGAAPAGPPGVPPGVMGGAGGAGGLGGLSPQEQTLLMQLLKKAKQGQGPVVEQLPSFMPTPPPPGPFAPPFFPGVR